jgi:hypothetical protein
MEKQKEAEAKQTKTDKSPQSGFLFG